MPRVLFTFALTTLMSFLLLVLIGIGTSTIQANSFFAFVGYLLLTAFIIKINLGKLSENILIIICFSSMLLLQSYTVYLYIFESASSLPIVIIYSLGIISGFLSLKMKKSHFLLLLSLNFIFLIFMFFQGWEYWQNKINFGTFTGKVEAYNLSTKFEAFDEQKKILTDEDFNKKIVLLDFWTTTCGLCFKKFPQVQSVYEKYKNDPSTMILAVNSPIEEDKPNQAFNDIREEGYSFQTVIAKDEDLAEKFGVKGYPTTFVINQNKQIVYKGDIEGAIRMVDELREPK